MGVHRHGHGRSEKCLPSSEPNSLLIDWLVHGRTPSAAGRVPRGEKPPQAANAKPALPSFNQETARPARNRHFHGRETHRNKYGIHSGQDDASSKNRSKRCVRESQVEKARPVRQAGARPRCCGGGGGSAAGRGGDLGGDAVQGLPVTVHERVVQLLAALHVLPVQRVHIQLGARLCNTPVEQHEGTRA